MLSQSYYADAWHTVPKAILPTKTKKKTLVVQRICRVPSAHSHVDSWIAGIDGWLCYALRDHSISFFAQMIM